MHQLNDRGVIERVPQLLLIWGTRARERRYRIPSAPAHRPFSRSAGSAGCASPGNASRKVDDPDATAIAPERAARAMRIMCYRSSAEAETKQSQGPGGRDRSSLIRPTISMENADAARQPSEESASFLRLGQANCMRQLICWLVGLAH